MAIKLFDVLLSHIATNNDHTYIDNAIEAIFQVYK